MLTALSLALLAIPGTWAQDAGATRPADSGAPAGYDYGFILPIEDEITDITYNSLERRLRQIGQRNPELIIIELDTPGGALGPTLDICDKIKDLRDQGVKTYAWINNHAYSAGTIIALATDGIIMATKTAVIGDCQPIQITPGGVEAIPEDISAKATSPLLAELRDSARRNNYNLDMVVALIRPEIEIFWLEDSKTGERRFVDARGRDELFGLGDKTEDRSGGQGGGLIRLFKGKSETKRREPGEVVPDDQSKTAWRYVKSHPDLGEIKQPIVPHNELLTMKADVARAYGFSLGLVGSEEELRSFLHVKGPLERLESTYAESAIEWLASPMVRSIVFLLMLLAAYVELHTPGFGVAGGTALVLLVLFLGAPYLAGYTVTWEIVVIVVGLALLAVEGFVLPGFGVAGIAGIVLLVVGVLASFVPKDPTWPGFGPSWELPKLPATYDYLRHGLYSMAAGLIGAMAGMVLLARYLPKVPVAGRLIAPNPEHDAVQMDDPYADAARLGDVGTAESLLRPAGKARFGNTLVDVVSQGEYIEGGTRIEVVERHGNRVVVRRVD